MSTTVKMSKKAKDIIDLAYISSLGIKSYDADNLYPQNIRKIVLNSKVATTCMERYIDFIEGNGISDDALSKFVVNRNGQTLDALHSLLSSDLAFFYGFAIHLNYNLDGDIVELQHIPFENVRLCEPDSEGDVGYVMIHPDWTGKTTRNGMQIRVTADNCDKINVFNPKKTVVQNQIINAGGIEHYKGQVYYFSRNGYMTYPLSRYTSGLVDMSTDAGLSNVSHRNVRNNFLPAGMLTHFKVKDSYDEDSRYDDVGYSDMINDLMTDENSCKIAEIEIEDENEIPKFSEISAHNYDKDFTVTADEVKESIYSLFNQEVFLSIRKGKLGFSGNLIHDAENHYALKVRKEQRWLTESYMKILERWGSVLNPLPALPTMDALTIQSFVESVESIKKENE